LSGRKEETCWSQSAVRFAHLLTGSRTCVQIPVKFMDLHNSTPPRVFGILRSTAGAGAAITATAGARHNEMRDVNCILDLLGWNSNFGIGIEGGAVTSVDY